MKELVAYRVVLSLAIVSLLMQGCTKDPLPDSFSKPTITASFSDVSSDSVRLQGESTKTNFSSCGFYYGTTEAHVDQNSITVKNGSGNLGRVRSFPATLSDLLPATTYYFQAYVSNGRSVTTSRIYEFTTMAVPATGVSLDKTSLTLIVGRRETLEATLHPANATDEITWSSSNLSVATVSEGIVTACGVGVAVITAKAGSKTATCTVTVIRR